MNILHLSPTHPRTYVGGGERYALSLAKAQAELPHLSVRFVSFGEQASEYTDGPLGIQILEPDYWARSNLINPVSWQLASHIIASDVVHVHQRQTLLNDMAVIAAKVLHRPVFVTDLGGGAESLGVTSPLTEMVDGYLCISSFAAALRPAREDQIHIIGAGVDFSRFYRPPDAVREGYFLFVGRLLPHKGVNYLIQAVVTHRLKVVGQPYDAQYRQALAELAAGKSVEFVDTASDDDLRVQYRGAYATILPSVYKDMYGNRYDNPELFGLVLAESMACGTPVICTSVGALPELVEDGRTGFIVPPNDPKALAERMCAFVEQPDLADTMGAAAYETIRQRCSWRAVAMRCLAAYRRHLSRASA